MPVYKQVWQYGDSNGATFSETHYIEASNAGAAASMPVEELVNFRLAFLDSNFTLQRIRSTLVGGNRDTGNQGYGLLGSSQADVDQDITPYVASTAAVFTLSGATGGSRRWWCRGLNEGMIWRSASTGKVMTAPTFVNNVRQFIQQCAGRQMGLRRLVPTPKTSFNFVPITGISAAAVTGNAILTLQTAMPVTTNDSIIVYGVNQKDYNGLQGTFKVMATTGQAITINYRCPPLPASPTISGTVRKSEFSPLSVYSPTGIGLHHFGDHQTKSPLFGSRGARRAQRLRTRS